MKIYNWLYSLFIKRKPVVGDTWEFIIPFVPKHPWDKDNDFSIRVFILDVKDGWIKGSVDNHPNVLFYQKINEFILVFNYIYNMVDN